jgi:hypothetical protein
MTQLITISDIIGLKTISVNVNADKKLNPFILEAQQFDLKELMGSEFYLEFINDFVGSPSLSLYSDLFNGCEFVYCEKTIRHEGIKSVLAYLSYARYVLNSNVEATAFGTVNKITEESRHVEDKTIKRLYEQAYAGAMSYWKDVVKYLEVQDYETWNSKNKKKRAYSFRVKGISKNDC